jgi:hypothetical protein
MYWDGIEETAERVCDKHGVRQIERSVDGIVWGVLTVLDGGKKLVKDQWERKLYSDLTGWTVEPNSNLISLEVSKI